MKGKIIGFIIGLLIANIFGAIIGGVIGHFLVDEKKRNQFQTQYINSSIFGTRLTPASLFIQTTFAVLGHLSKAKGRVTEFDIEWARDTMAKMQLNQESRQLAQKAFQKGKASSFPLRTAIRELVIAYHHRNDLLQMFLEIQFQAAANDGELQQEERRILELVAEELGVSHYQFEQLLNMFFASQHFEQEYDEEKDYSYQSQREHSYHRNEPSLRDAFAVIGVSEDSDQATVKKAYRRLMHEYHPDRLVAKGLPEEMMKMATQKTQQIQAAYALICKAKGWR